MKKIKIGLLPRVIIAIIAGIVFGQFLPMPITRLFATFNAIFGEFLSFSIPLIIIGLVTPAIADIGKGAGKLLVITVLIAYIDTIAAALLAYGTGTVFFPPMVDSARNVVNIESASSILPYFGIKIPPMLDVMTSLVLSFVVGLGIAYGKKFSTAQAGNAGGDGVSALHQVVLEFHDIISRLISSAIIPLLPVYIFGIFLSMAVTGQVYGVLAVFVQIIIVIFILHIVVLLYEFIFAGVFAKRNPFRLLWNMLPAYLTALGTSSSAATIPVTLKQAKVNGVSDKVAGFVIPLCATIHLSGSAMKITACALTICLMSDKACDLGTFINFTMLLGIVMVAAPGVPGGAIMACLGVLASVLGFSEEEQALMISLYIAMDSFGTACNVTGDGAIAVVMNKMFK